MNRDEIYALVRKIDPAHFSEEAHGPGFRVMLEERGRASIYEPGLLNRLLGRRGIAQYYVRKLPAPLVVSWPFRWAEGTSNIALEFMATFSLQVTQADEACRLVEALTIHASTGESLFSLIDEALHECLSSLATVCAGSERNLLAHFRDSSLGAGESADLNRQVTDKVSARLGCRQFRIGLSLKNAPPMQITVETHDDFMLADSTRMRKVDTKALLQFDNYQAYKKAGLEAEESIRDAIKKSITEAVRRNLFAVKYHDVVKSFASGSGSLEDKMRADIAADAKRLGYCVQMFQSFPGIAALDLLRGIRIDIAAESLKYRPKNSIGYVQMELALSVSARNLDLLHRLVDPDDKQKIDQLVSQHVQQICQDEIQKIDRQAFNLHFDDEIVPKLERAIAHGLEHYGLDAEIIKIVQAPTDESFRFRALCSEPATPFVANVAAHADEGETDPVSIEGRIEITGIHEGSWDKFEGKDFGFRADSGWTDARLRDAVTKLGRPTPLSNPLSVADRRSLAIIVELDEIRSRVVSELQAKLSNVRNLGRQWTTVQRSKEIEQSLQLVVSEAIADEFGLAVVLRGVERRDTDTEITNSVRRQEKHKMLRGAAQIDAQAAIERRAAAVAREADTRRRLHEADGEAIREAIANDIDLPERLAEKVQALDATEASSRPMTMEDAEDVLRPSRKTSRAGTQLPGEKGAQQSRELTRREPDSEC